jgi:hypothetical protein
MKPVHTLLLLSLISGDVGCSAQENGPPASPPPPGTPQPPPPPGLPEGAVRIVVDPATRFQRIDGWETSVRMWEQDKANDRFARSIEQYATAVANFLVDSVGINTVRLHAYSGMENPRNDWAPFYSGQMSYTEWSPGRYEKVNDNNDPMVANLAGFHFESLDYLVEQMVLPMRSALTARGEQLRVNLNYTDFKWNAARQGTLSHATNPAEFAEFVLVCFQHLRDKYGIIPDSFELILEPENTVSWTGGNIGHALVAVAARLSAAGFHPEFIVPSTTNMSHAVTYFNAVVAVPGAGALVSTLAYHRYGGESAANAQAIRAAAAARGSKTAMLEKVGAGIDQLMEDLTVANVSAWQQWAMADESGHADDGAYYLRAQLGAPPATAIRMASRTPHLAHVFRSVRRGAVRVGSSSSASDHTVAAFINPDGQPVVVVRSRQAGSLVAIEGLPAGSYGIRTTSEFGVEATSAPVTIAAGGWVPLQSPKSGIATIYRLP